MPVAANTMAVEAVQRSEARTGSEELEVPTVSNNRSVAG